jgi:AAA15 family ATPase/GTPase
VLIDYTFKNILSFKDQALFSMVAVKSFKEFENINSISQNGYALLKSAALYGNNASGKSNFIKSIHIMKQLVLNSFRDALSEKESPGQWGQPFLLDTYSSDAPSEFEVTFIADEIRYRYGFHILKNTIQYEYLYAVPGQREVNYFIREGTHFQINKSSFREGLGLEDKTRENVLFLSLLSQFNGKISSSIIEWFKNIKIISAMNDFGYSTYTISRLHKDAAFRQWMIKMLRFLEISNMSIEESELSPGEKAELTERLKDPGIALGKGLKLNVSTWHNVYDRDKLLADSVSFDLNTQESEGTKKFIYMLGPLYDTLKYGRVLFIDEFDSRFHPHLSRQLFHLFHTEENRRAQLITVVHDVSVMDRELLRRDQIWFIEKDQYGASKLYSLADFKTELVRNTSSYSKNYLQGKYGAVSEFQVNESITDGLYGKE